MDKLVELWIDSCEDLWEVTRTRPYINRDELTLWDAFHYMYLKRTSGDGKTGRRSLLGDKK